MAILAKMDDLLYSIRRQCQVGVWCRRHKRRTNKKGTRRRHREAVRFHQGKGDGQLWKGGRSYRHDKAARMTSTKEEGECDEHLGPARTGYASLVREHTNAAQRVAQDQRDHYPSRRESANLGGLDHLNTS